MSTLMVSMPRSMAAPTRTERARASQARPAGARAEQSRRLEARTTSAGRPSSLRLTRRGRLLVSASVVATAAVGMSVGLHGSAQASDTVSTRAVVVEPGQSLWQIARSVSPQRDPRDVVADIVAANHLDGVVVQPGQELQVPVRR